MDNMVPRSEMLEALTNQRRSLCAETDRVIAARDQAQRVGKRWGQALAQILEYGHKSSYGDVYTTGEGHAECREIARKALQGVPEDTTPPQPADGGDRELRKIADEMRNRKVNHGKAHSPTLIAWADRIDAALAKFQPAGGES